MPFMHSMPETPLKAPSETEGSEAEGPGTGSITPELGVAQRHVRSCPPTRPPKPRRRGKLRM